ncbi:TIR domain-containing protein [Sorangium sp. So ce1389]|uniref:TIR domain-containing protein n=1 Tax=Sorangium sp. So ce1389 TaxID=3133336 RepID=UPI003F5EAAA7
MAGEVIDFSIERSRHARFFGREDVLAAIERLLAEEAGSSGWVLVLGGPGMGKSAILSRWLAAEERRGRRVPHHFLRRDVMDWDRPDAISRSLSAQIEALYPGQKDSEATPESRLVELLARVSQRELVPRRERLVLLVDGLDEARSEGAGQNPLLSFLPYALPPRVQMLCASRPQYPHLAALESRGSVRRIDLDAPAWATSNEEACRAFWVHHGPLFVPALPGRLIEEAVVKGQGNLLYASKLREWLQDQPPDQRRAARLPRGLSGFLEQVWRQLRGLSRERFRIVCDGLGLLCAAREALPLEEVQAALGWDDLQTREDFLEATRALLLEEPEHWRGARAYRPYHEAFRDFVVEKLGPTRMGELHRQLLRTTARWPVEEGSEFRKQYAPRHAIGHALVAGERETARALCKDVELLAALCRESGPSALEEALRQAAKELADDEIGLIHRAVRAESHWLREANDSLKVLLYNRLRSAGWDAARIEPMFRPPRGLPTLRLRHPVRMWTGVERTLSGHLDSVTACAITPDGERVVSGSSDTTLKVWDLASGHLLSTLEGHTARINACAISPDGERVVSASSDRTLKVWDLASGRLLSTLEGHTDGVNACAISPDGERIVSGSSDKRLIVWGCADYLPLYLLDSQGPVNVHALSSDGVSSLLQRPDAMSGSADVGRRYILQGHDDRVSACAISPDGKLVAATSYDKTLRVWHLASGEGCAVFEAHRDWASACAISPDGERMVSASYDMTLKVWDVVNSRLLAVLAGHDDWVVACAISPDGERIVSASHDKTLKVWDAASGRVLYTLEGHSAGVYACAISPDGQRVVSGSGDGTLKVWDVASGHLPSSLEGHAARVTGCAISPDNERIVSASWDMTLRVWDVASGRPLHVIGGSSRTGTSQSHLDKVTGCAISPDGKRIVSCSYDRTLRIWDVANGQLVSIIEGHSDWIMACAISPDSRYVVSASGDTTLRLWDFGTGKLLSTMKGHGDWVNSCAISPDGERIVSASEDETLKVWDRSTARLLFTLRGHFGSVKACAISPDGSRIVSGSNDCTLKVWDLASGKLLSTCAGHLSSVRGCAFTVDGRWIASASDDKTLKLWDASTARCMATVPGISPFVCVTTSQGLLCAGDRNGNLWSFDCASPSPHAAAPAVRRPARVFFSYSHKDEALRDELETHLALLKREGLLEGWHDRRILGGEARQSEVDNHLEAADVILLLVSADFVASDYCYDTEMRRALERHDAGEARVIPIVLRPSDWSIGPFARLQALPSDARAVTRWEDRDEAWTDVAKGIRGAIAGLARRARP